MTDNPMQHSWDVTPQEAIAIQQRLRTTVVTQDTLGDVHFVAGVDVGFEAGGTITRAAVAVLRFPELVLHEQAIARRPTSFPYIPGFLSFREVPAILEALDGLVTRPDLLLCDGQGYIHPRRFGLACHLGVLTDLPSIGVGKTPFIGRHAPVGNERGDWQPIIDHEEVIGAVVRSKPSVQPIYVSIGHRICLTTAIDYVLRCTTKYRLPETTRWAHNLASRKDRSYQP